MSGTQHRNFFPGVSQGLTLFFLTAFFALTRLLTPVRRVRWHFQMIAAFFSLVFIVNAHELGTLSFFAWVLIATFSYGFLSHLGSDQRLKRTLQATGSAS